MKKLKVMIIASFSMLALVVGFAGMATAQAVKTGDTVFVGAQETVDGMLFAAGSTVDIAGEVNGDVYCAGQTVSISGTVRGDVFCAGQTVRVSGTVEGSVRIAGQSVNFAGKISDSATVGAQSLLTESGSTIGRDLLGGSESATLNGTIARDLAIGATSLVVNNQVGRNIAGGVENLTLTSSAKVGGDITYQSPNQPRIADNAQIIGTVNRTEPKQQPKATYIAPFALTFLTVLYIFTALMLVILALALFIPRVMHEATTAAIKKPGKTTLVGFVYIILAPVVVITLMVTVIGIPLATMILLVWLITAMLSGPFAAYLLGRLLLRRSNSPLLIALVGGTVLLAMYLIPFVGLLALISAYIFGSGIVVTELGSKLPRPSQKLR
jgi:cytoskeletal protein CcmA (bactofilin family)